jgi:hypothetical protein
MKDSSGTICWRNSINAEENVNWQYRTILFEYVKDGLLGDKYIDDEEVEKILNEQGEQGWELVGVTSVQEGLLSFFKRVRLPARREQAGRGVSGEPVRPAAPQPHVSAASRDEPAKGSGRAAVEQKTGPPGKKTDTVGGIRIS